MKYITILLPLLLSGCILGTRVHKIEPGNPPPALTQPFTDIDTDKDGVISKTEYQIVAPKPQDIDISTPVNVFVWVIVTMIIICLLAVLLPKATRWVRCYLKNRKCRNASENEKTVLNG